MSRSLDKVDPWRVEIGASLTSYVLSQVTKRTKASALIMLIRVAITTEQAVSETRTRAFDETRTPVIGSGEIDTAERTYDIVRTSFP